MPSLSISTPEMLLGALPLTVTFCGVKEVASEVVPVRSRLRAAPFGTAMLMEDAPVSWPLESKVTVWLPSAEVV